jgi:hypothetical protein
MYALAPLPLDGSLVVCPKRSQQTLARAPETPFRRRVPTPSTQLDKTVIGRLNGQTFRVFSTHVGDGTHSLF